MFLLPELFLWDNPLTEAQAYDIMGLLLCGEQEQGAKSKGGGDGVPLHIV